MEGLPGIYGDSKERGDANCAQPRGLPGCRCFCYAAAARVDPSPLTAEADSESFQSAAVIMTCCR
jgi:hypothetical protein